MGGPASHDWVTQGRPVFLLMLMLVLILLLSLMLDICMTRSATIYIGEDRIVLQSHDFCDEGFYLVGTCVRTLPHSATVESILTELDRVLTESKTGVSTPADPKT